MLPLPPFQHLLAVAGTLLGAILIQPYYYRFVIFVADLLRRPA